MAHSCDTRPPASAAARARAPEARARPAHWQVSFWVWVWEAAPLAHNTAHPAPHCLARAAQREAFVATLLSQRKLRAPFLHISHMLPSRGTPAPIHSGGPRPTALTSAHTRVLRPQVGPLTCRSCGAVTPCHPRPPATHGTSMRLQAAARLCAPTRALAPQRTCRRRCPWRHAPRIALARRALPIAIFACAEHVGASHAAGSGLLSAIPSLLARALSASIAPGPPPGADSLNRGSRTRARAPLPRTPHPDRRAHARQWPRAISTPCVSCLGFTPLHSRTASWPPPAVAHRRQREAAAGAHPRLRRGLLPQNARAARRRRPPGNPVSSRALPLQNPNPTFPRAHTRERESRRGAPGTHNAPAQPAAAGVPATPAAVRAQRARSLGPRGRGRFPAWRTRGPARVHLVHVNVRRPPSTVLPRARDHGRRGGGCLRSRAAPPLRRACAALIRVVSRASCAQS